MRGLGVTSNIFLISSMAIITVTNAFTSKSIMPAMTIFFSFQKLFTLSVIDTPDDLIRRFLQYFSYTYVENQWFRMGGDSFASHGERKETYTDDKSMTGRSEAARRNLIENDWVEYENLNFEGKQKYESSSH